MKIKERIPCILVLVGLLGAAPLSRPACGEEPVDLFQFGQAAQFDRLTHLFHVRNDGQGRLEISSATPSCECLQVLNWTSVVEPGATGTVEVLFVPDHVGTVDYRVQLQTSSGEHPVLELAIRGEVQAFAPARTDRDWSLYLDAGQIEAAVHGATTAVWIDVRSAEAYQRDRIPDSIQMPLFAVKTKGFLRDRRVVLVDEGHGSRATEEECRRLRTMGFGDLWIWYGGLNAWQQLGGRLDRLQPGPLDRIPPADVSDILRSTDWLAVAIGSPADTLGSAAIELTWDPDDPARLGAVLRQAMAERPQTLCLLIATETGGDYEQLAAAVGTMDAHVFYLEGGLAAWTAHRQMVNAMQQSGRRSTQSRAVTGGGRRTGCGGCPKMVAP